MSLFDVIKYGNTDLHSREELSELPCELFDMYRIAAFDYYGQTWCTTSPRDRRIRGMAGWTEAYAIKQTIFDKVLREYNIL